MAVRKLEKAAKWNDPSQLFGSHVASRYSSISNFGRKFNPGNQIHEELKSLVREAAGTIDRALLHSQDYVHGELHDCRRAHNAGERDDFTYFSLNENDVPWNDEAEWEEPAKVPVPVLKAASEDVLNALGMMVSDAIARSK